MPTLFPTRKRLSAFPAEAVEGESDAQFRGPDFKRTRFKRTFMVDQSALQRRTTFGILNTSSTQSATTNLYYNTNERSAFTSEG